MTIALILSPFFLMGVIPLLIGLHFYKKGKKYVSESKCTTGEIVDVVLGIKGLDGPSGWVPKIKYWDERANSYLIYKSSTGHAFKWKFTIGDTIQLRYLYTDKGIDIRTDVPIAIYGVSKYIMVFGAILAGLSIIIVVAYQLLFYIASLTI